MEPKFKTSFIPKQSLAQAAIPGGAPRVHAPRGILFFISFVIFLITIVGAGGIFFYTKFLDSSIVTKKEQLVRAQAAFEPETIQTLARVDKRIEASKLILEEHIAPSSLFALLEQTTLASVRFNKFTYTFSPDGRAQLDLTGEAKDFSGLALQSDVLGSNNALRGMVVDTFEYSDSGAVSFHILASADKSFIRFLPTGSASGGDGVQGLLNTSELEIGNTTSEAQGAVESGSVGASTKTATSSTQTKTSSSSTSAPVSTGGTSTPASTTKTPAASTPQNNSGFSGPSTPPPPPTLP